MYLVTFKLSSFWMINGRYVFDFSLKENGATVLPVDLVGEFVCNLKSSVALQ